MVRLGGVRCGVVGPCEVWYGPVRCGTTGNDLLFILRQRKAHNMWRTCFDCGKVISAGLISRLIVVKNENNKDWHFADEDELNDNDVSKLSEEYFCRKCNE